MRRDFYPQGVPVSINYPEIPLHFFLENSARKFPNREALVYYGRRITYSQLWGESRRMASSLKRLGVRKGDRVGLIMPNTPQFVIAYYAALMVGGVVVAVNPLNDPNEVERELAETDSKAVIVLDRFLEKVKPREGREIIVASPGEYLPPHLKLLYRLKSLSLKARDEALRFEKMVKAEPLGSGESIDPKQDLAVIQYTSGTAGKPKGVMLTHFNLVANTLQTFYWLRGWGYSNKPQLRGWPIVVCAIPFFHIYGMTVGLNESIHFGSTLVLIPDPKPLAIIRAIDRFAATHFPAIPQMIKGIIEHPRVKDFNLRTLTSCVCGGAAIDSSLIERFVEMTGAIFYQGYGLTEAGPVTHCTTIRGEASSGSVGLAFPDTEAKIVDLRRGTIELPMGAVGEIVVRGPQIMRGYWRDAELTSKVLKDGWLYTGDVGRMDEGGFLYIINRKEEEIIASGHTVWPSQVESVLSSHPLVGSAVVLGEPDPLRCATDLKAFVVLKEGVDREEASRDLMEYCEERLEAFQTPSKIVFVDELPLTLMGKVDREALKSRINL
ncbi:MAG: AMP-binding protein [Candidatus Bathyarchaeia archaeon]